MDDTVEVGEGFEVIGTRHTATEGFLYLVGRGVPRPGGAKQRIDRPCRGAARGFVAGGNERDHLIANLSVAQGFSSLGAAIDQRGQHVVIGAAVGTGPLDLGMD
jgi:hypothetical protein